jgi:5-formyltetrahydrofolate cyclo-ligase
MRARLKQLSSTERQRQSRQICESILPLLSGRKSIALFAPALTEPDLDILWEVAPLGQHVFSYPRCEGSTLSFRPVSALSELLPGRFGIRAPNPGPSLEQLDLIIVPGLAFTSEGWRLGRGSGYYDRFLSGIPGTTFKLGVCFDFQFLAEIPHEPHDVKMDVVVCR